MPGRLAGTRVLVIGASGFIGSRLTERLVVECGAHVRVLVRSVMSAAAIARFPIDIVVGDMLDPAAVSAAADGCSVIFNCAKGKGGDAAVRRAVDVDGVGHVIEAAQRASARVVHTSTMAVYDRPVDGEFDERTSPAPRGDAYADGKRDGEDLALAYGARHRVPVTVIQPAVVYGPGAGVYGAEILADLRAGRIMLIDGGRGICNAVYVDDVVSALLLASTSDRAAGERVLVSGPEHPTWSSFLGAFERMLGERRTVSVSRPEAHALWRRSRRRASLASELWRIVRADRALRTRLLSTREGHLAREIAERTWPDSWRAWARRERDGAVNGTIDENRVIPMRPWVVDNMARRARVRTQKARDLLGYEPLFNLDTGMRLTEQWARWAGHLPDIPGK